MNVFVRVLAIDVEDELVKGFQFDMKKGDTLFDLVAELSGLYPQFRKKLSDESGQLLPSTKVVINNRVTDGMNIEVPSGSEIVFFPTMLGG